MHGIITLPMPLPTEKGHTYVILKLFADNYRNEKGTETRLGKLSSPIPVFPRMLSILQKVSFSQILSYNNYNLL